MSKQPETIQEMHPRLASLGYTRWTLAEVEAAFNEAQAALDACRAARQLACDTLNADPGYQKFHALPAYWECIETPKARAAYQLLRTDTYDGCPNFPFKGDARLLIGPSRGGKVEYFPLTQWAKQVKQWRRWAQRVNKELA